MKKDKPAKPITIQEIATWKVTGSVSTPEATKTDRETHIWITAGQDQTQVKPDANGRFEFEVPDGVEISIYMVGSSGSGSMHFPRPTTKTLKSFRKHFKGLQEHTQMFTLKDIHSDIGPLDFTMEPYEAETISATDMFWEWLLFGG